jgi:PBP1b-binding outer membrane lipoprotein LpoB
MKQSIIIGILILIMCISGCSEPYEGDPPTPEMIIQTEMERNLSCTIDSCNNTLTIAGYVKNLDWMDYKVKANNQSFDEYLVFISLDQIMNKAVFNSTSWNPIKGDDFRIKIIHENENRVYWKKDVLAS